MSSVTSPASKREDKKKVRVELIICWKLQIIISSLYHYSFLGTNKAQRRNRKIVTRQKLITKIMKVPNNLCAKFLGAAFLSTHFYKYALIVANISS